MNARAEAAALIRSTDDAWRRRTVWSVLAGQAASRGPHEYVVALDASGGMTRITFAQMEERARALSGGLAGIGVRRGDRVALLMTNLPEFLYSYFAVMRLGAIVVPINTFLGAEEIHYVLRRSGARFLILMDRFRKIDYTELLTLLVPEWPGAGPGRLLSERLPDLRHVIVHRRADAPNEGLAGLMESGRTRTAEQAAAMEREARAEDTGLIIFTSGSTGFPKGVRLEQWGLITNNTLYARRLAITDRDRYFSQMPLFHMGGTTRGVFTMLVVGGTLVMGETNDGEQAIRAIETERCTVYNGVPAMQYDMLEALERRPADLRSMRMAGHLIDETLRARLWAPFGVGGFLSTFGLTETYGPATTPHPADMAAPTGALGHPLEGAEVAIVEPGTTTSLAQGRIGEILLRGMLMSGYHEMPEETAAVIDEEGWLHTGDLGLIEPNGALRFVGRIKTMVKVGGENVAAEEVEDVLKQIPAVIEACVLGQPDQRLGEVPYAYVKAEAGASPDDAGMREFVSARLARFKVPRAVIVLDPFPMTATGKPDRAAIAKIHRERAGR